MLRTVLGPRLCISAFSFSPAPPPHHLAFCSTPPHPLLLPQGLISSPLPNLLCFPVPGLVQRQDSFGNFHPSLTALQQIPSASSSRSTWARIASPTCQIPIPLNPRALPLCSTNFSRSARSRLPPPWGFFLMGLKQAHPQLSVVPFPSKRSSLAFRTRLVSVVSRLLAAPSTSGIPVPLYPALSPPLGTLSHFTSTPLPDL